MLLETTETTRHQGIIKTKEVPEIRSESVGKTVKANPESGSEFSGLHHLVIYHRITQSPKLKCLKQQLFCMLMILWAEIGTKHTRNCLCLFHVTYAGVGTSNIVPSYT